MISIRKTTNELERLEASLRIATEVYENGLLATAQYAVELNPADVLNFRQHLDGIRERIPRGPNEEEWRNAQASFRGELREFRDKARERIAGLHLEIRNAAEAMQSFAESVAASGTGHEKEIRTSLAELDRATRSESIAEIHGIVANVRESVAHSVERITQRHQMMIAELRDEVRMLHQHIEAERHTAALDVSTGVWNRMKLDSRISGLLEAREPFCLLLVRIRNFKQTEVRYSREVLEGALKALLQRLTGMLGNKSKVGRWNEDSFAAVLEAEPAAVIRLSRDVTQRLSGMYSVQVNGSAHSVSFHVTAGVIDRATGGDAQSFHKKLVQMSEALGVT